MLQLNARELREIDQELKEAVCEALVNMTVEQTIGSGPDAEYVYGPSPRRSVVAGHLLPRFDPTNQQDDTSDIQIAAVGMDFQIDKDADDLIEAAPAFSVYVRVLPTWEDLSDEALGLEINFRIQTAIQRQIDTRVRQLRLEAFTRENVATPPWATLTPLQKDEVRKRREDLQRQALIEAYGEQGILLEGRPDEIREVSNEEESEDVNSTDPATAVEAPEDQSARISIGRLLQRGRTIPVSLLAPADPPPKWKRLVLASPTLQWKASEARPEVLDDFARRWREGCLRQVVDWLNSEEGQHTAWRDEPVLPDDCRSAESWNAYLERAARQPIPLPQVLPRLDGIRVDVDQNTDFTDPSRVSVRVAIDNGSAALTKREARTCCEVLFNVSLTVRLPSKIHQPLRLDRVEPSYRFRHFLTYAAIGLNCGVVAKNDGDQLSLATTFAPRFIQPRIIPRELDMPVAFGALSDPAFPVATLRVLPKAYKEWIDAEETRLRTAVRDGLSSDDAERESERLRVDIAGQRAEVEYIERGIRLLEEAQEASRRLGAARSEADKRDLSARAAPYQAWLQTNSSFFETYNRDQERGWRLFQLAFVLAHVPTLASRIESYRSYQNHLFDEESASLLYFPTGGGKSEAFYGTLVFAMFLDRLRGKARGVTALIRYPLRLLTLQQGQRLLKLVAHAELIRIRERINGWPFEIGFWVGGNNTPNRYSEVPSAVPTMGAPVNDEALEEGVAGRTEDEEKAAQSYRDFRAAYNKIPECPVCRSATGLRRFVSEGPTAQRLAIVCFNMKCDYNEAHGGQTPLPFLLTDDTIYARAPSIVLGTVDKLAMLGQHTSTIRQFMGMFGLARGIGPSGHLFSPRVEGDSAATLSDGGYDLVFPAFRAGRRVFFDPFPSLVIQDEAHLLEESLGTFSGLFDSLFETTLRRIDAMAGAELDVARVWTGDRYGDARTPKFIAATATISNPERQLDVLYQRQPLRFPYPGSDLYRSFFSAPAKAPQGNSDRVAMERRLKPSEAPELTAPWMRLFVSLMTNGATHTVTTVAVLGAFHTVISRLWRTVFDDGTRAAALLRLKDAQGGPDGGWRRAAIDRASAEGRETEILALLDLHRIALAYVTNKKGGDQVIDALDAAVHHRHRLLHEPFTSFPSRLISGGVDMKEIQEVMELAESANPGKPYLELADRLRSIVATSAISHGVDVDRFNSMFFAGLPSDIAEYIQASSRVGRTHVGFVLLVPTPQSRRDRYVVETHDIFHRFLERMIAPPAVERWAENAIRRVLASVVQAWAILEENSLFLAAPDEKKPRLPSYENTAPLTRAAGRDVTGLASEIGAFALEAIGYEGRNGRGGPVYKDVYRALVEREVTNLVRSLKTLEGPMRMQQYWDDSSAPLKAPMTSLRDVDEAGVITAGAYDALARGPRGINSDDLLHVMKVIRHQRGAMGELDGDAVQGARP